MNRMSREVSKLYRELAEAPVYTSAYFLKSGASFSNVRVNTSVRDHLRQTKRSIGKNIVFTQSEVVVTSSQDNSDALTSVPSPSGKRMGVLREVSEGSSKKRFVEVWLGNRLEAIKEVTKTHEDFHLNPLFFSLSFSKSESSFVYSAEAKAPDTNSDEEDSEKTAKFRFLPDFGERLIGKRRPTLYLFRWSPRRYENNDDQSCATDQTNDQAEPTVVILKPTLPEGSTYKLGQAVFAPDQRTIFATGYEETFEGRRLGVVGCWNHASSIFRLNLPSDIPDSAQEVDVSAQRLTPPELCARSPRVTDAPAGKPYTTVWLTNPVDGPHASATSLVALPSDQSEPKILVDSVFEPKDTDSFPGLYVDQLPSSPFLSLGPSAETATHLVTPSTWRSRLTVLGISLSSGQVHELTPVENQAWTVAGTDGRNGVLAIRSAINSPQELLHATLPNIEETPSWRVIDKPILSTWAREKLATLTSSTLPIPDRFPTEVITFQITGAKNLPLLTIPHGGPHYTFSSEFIPATAALALDGYIVSLVNYTGSLGFGQKYVDALIGRSGELDVRDTYESAKHLVKLGLAHEGPGKQFVQGGSHGGFLSAHLIGQYPEFFSATVLRNPVISTGEMASLSDIPDWAFAQFGAAFGPKTIISPGVFEKLQRASPIAYVDAMKAPVLLLAGEIDQRVPPSQSRNFYFALKGRGKEVELLMFPGNGHSLDTVEAELVGWVAGRDWLEKFAKR